MKVKQLWLTAALITTACAPVPAGPVRIPSLEYANRVKQERAKTDPEYRRKLAYEQQSFTSPALEEMKTTAAAASPAAPAQSEPRASMKLGEQEGQPAEAADAGKPMVTNLSADGSISAASGYEVYRSSQPQIRDYNGPLAFGDPGLSPSLWKESSTGTNLFRDYRAYQPMDLITIIVTENSQGKNKANTNVKQESTISAAISKFFGVEQAVVEANPSVDPNALIEAQAKSEHKGEGSTDRSGELRANISAMVVEVLPSGILRIEGEKIISVNSEDQVMVINGLVRPEDVNSNNAVDSAKVANVRIDYYGKGSVGNAQHGGWFANFFRRFWPM